MSREDSFMRHFRFQLLTALIAFGPVLLAAPSLAGEVPPELLGCRVTGGRGTQDETNPALTFDIQRSSGGGHVGAPCGSIGCFDDFDHIQGNWQHSRKKKAGTFHAKDYNSLLCSCRNA